MNLRFGALVGVCWVATCWVAACGGRSTNLGDDPVSGGSGGSKDSGGSTSSGGSDGGPVSSGGSDGGGVSSGGSDDGSGGEAPLASGGSDAGGAFSTGGEPSAGTGGSIDLPLRSCNSSDGSGCEANELCVDDVDLCFPDSSSGCEGTCATKREPSSCEGGVADCSGSVTCPEQPGPCPDGKFYSIVDGCFGPCVPADCCACESDSQCYAAEVSCDREAGRCVSLEAPEPRCRQPFDPGSCSDLWRVFAFIDGSCQERMASTCGSAPTGNQFFTLEECLMRCEGLPAQGECPEGRVARRTCLECGAGGGCSKYAMVCAKTCQDENDCEAQFACFDGVCSVTGCA